MEQSQILFYLANKEYGCFSNFSQHSVTIDGLLYPTTQHYFQAWKYPHDKDHFQQIRTAKTCQETQKLANDSGQQRRKDWEEVQEDYMIVALRHKFTQHDDLRKILLSTGNKILVEDAKTDSYWGAGSDGTGKNRLGHCLMVVRDEIRENKIENGKLKSEATKPEEATIQNEEQPKD